MYIYIYHINISYQYIILIYHPEVDRISDVPDVQSYVQDAISGEKKTIPPAENPWLLLQNWGFN